MVNQGGSIDLQRIEAYHSLLGREGGMDDIRGTRDICVGAKRKEDPSSSNLGKRQRTSASHKFQDQGQPGPITCFYCHQPEHMKRDYPRRQESHGYGTPQSQSSVVVFTVSYTYSSESHLHIQNYTFHLHDRSTKPTMMNP